MTDQTTTICNKCGNMEPVETVGTAYVRLSKELKEILEMCEKRHGITGFAWDKEDPWSFGIILTKEEQK